MSGQQPPPYPGPSGDHPPGQPPGREPPAQPPPAYPGPPAQPPYPSQYGQPAAPPQQPYQGYPQQPYQGYPQQPYQGYPQYPGYAYAPAAKEPPDSTARMLGWVMAAAGLVVCVAAFLTWFSTEFPGGTADFRGLGFETVENIEVKAGDGLITLILAVVVVGFAVARGFGALSLTSAILGVVMGSLITLLAIADTATDEPIQVENPVTGETEPLTGVDWSVGLGLWLTLIAGIAMLLVSIVGIVKRR